MGQSLVRDVLAMFLQQTVSFPRLLISYSGFAFAHQLWQILFSDLFSLFSLSSGVSCDDRDLGSHDICSVCYNFVRLRVPILRADLPFFFLYLFLHSSRCIIIFVTRSSYKIDDPDVLYVPVFAISGERSLFLIDVFLEPSSPLLIFS